jgi:SPOR domain
MSMADDKRLRAQRTSEPMRRGGNRPDEGASGDPLAELARLIGQSDPFSDYGRRDGRNAAPREPQPQAAPDWRRQAASMPPYDAPEEAPRAPSRSEPRFPETFGGRDPYRAAEEPRHDPRHDPLYDPGYEERPSQYRREPQYQDDRYSDPRQDTRAYQDERAYDSHDQRSQPAYFDDGAPLGADDDEDYDDPPRSRRRSGLLTAVTLIGCAMIGTAGAYGYRNYYSAPGSNRAPPVISADTSPTKVVSAAEGPTGKSIKDRVGDTSERVIPREEEPVELRTPSRGSQSGFPSSAPGGVAAFAPPSGNASSSESKRVRTLTIRPDGDPPSRESTSRESSGRESSRESTSRTASNPPPSAAPPRPAPVPKNPPSRNSAPITLDAQEPATPPPAPRERTAVAAPPATTQGLQPPAPRAPAEGASGYSVQLSSQRSEGEAQASYRALQSKYPDQLSDRSVMIKRVDLGSKGVYYRAMVGPFSSSDEASQLCSELKAAGGQCLIQRN